MLRFLLAIIGWIAGFFLVGTGDEVNIYAGFLIGAICVLYIGVVIVKFSCREF